MSGFLTNDPLVLEFKTGITWKVVKEFTYIIDDNRKVVVPVGFCTDLASVPQLFWNLFPPSGGMYGKAGVIHDYMYYYGVVLDIKTNKLVPITRKEADDTLYQAMTDLNVPWYTKYIIWSGVRVGGMTVWNKYRQREIK